jgi:hypothetical protein
VAIPNCRNAAFVVNALDNLSGSDALIALRGRGADDRPFKLVNELRRQSEQRYREKEQALTAKLKEVQEQLAKLETAGEGANLILRRATGRRSRSSAATCSRSGASCARSSARCARTSIVSTAGSSSPTSRWCRC